MCFRFVLVLACQKLDLKTDSFPNMKRLFLILFLTLVCAVPIVQLPETNFFADTDSVEEALNQSAATDTLPECVAKKDTVTIVAVGDVQLGTFYPDFKYLPSYEAVCCFLNDVKPALAGGDVTFCNLEGCFADTSMGVRKIRNTKISHRFGVPAGYVDALCDAGFSLISTANNHSGDFAEPGRKLTSAVLDSVGFNWAGYLSRPYAVFEKDSVKYGFCAFSPNSGVCHIALKKRAVEMVKHLKRDLECDVVIVSFHAGGEGVDFQHVSRQKEFYVGTYRGNCYEFAHMLVEAGADLLLGHGPHVLRGAELYKGKLILYSMGNFATYSDISVSGLCGVSAVFRIRYYVPEGRFLSADIVSTYQQKPHKPGPHPDAKHRAFYCLRNLSQEDFPESSLRFVSPDLVEAK